MEKGINESQPIRAFVAIKLPDSVIEALRNIQQEINRGWRDVSWVKPDSIHLTLKFLGNIESGRVAEIAGELKKAASGIAPFTITVEGVGGFPNLKTPRVIWVGVKGEDAMFTLQKNIDERLNAIGFEKEDRPFQPHLTLCRVKSLSAGREAGRVVTELNPQIKTEFKADSFLFFKSVLNPKGAEYTILKRVDLPDKGS